MLPQTSRQRLARPHFAPQFGADPPWQVRKESRMRMAALWVLISLTGSALWLTLTPALCAGGS